MNQEWATRVRACNYVKIATRRNFPPVLKTVTHTGCIMLLSMHVTRPVFYRTKNECCQVDMRWTLVEGGDISNIYNRKTRQSRQVVLLLSGVQNCCRPLEWMIQVRCFWSWALPSYIHFTSTSRPPDVILVMNEPRSSVFFCCSFAFVYYRECKQNIKTGEAWERG